MNEMRLKILFLLMFMIILFGCERNNTTGTIDSSQTGNNYLKNCKDYSIFYVNDNYHVQNNVWGFYAGSYGSSFSQCIFYDSLQPAIFGWEWNLDSTSRYPSYPRVGYGWNPWFEQTTTQLLPRKLNMLNSAKASFDMEFSSDGIYNTSFDIWLTNSGIPNEENISAEIMIWLDANNSPETELTIDDLIIGNDTYSFYKNTSWYSYPLFIFVQKANTWNGQKNILPFLSYLLENSHISTENYLAVIEFGNEIWSGTGAMQLNNYTIEIE